MPKASDDSLFAPWCVESSLGEQVTSSLLPISFYIDCIVKRICLLPRYILHRKKDMFEYITYSVLLFYVRHGGVIRGSPHTIAVSSSPS